MLISEGCALSQIGLQKRNNSAESLILSSVRQFVGDQLTVAPVICAHEDAIVEGQAARSRSDKIDRSRRGFQGRMTRNRDRINPQQTNPLRISDANCPGVGDFIC